MQILRSSEAKLSFELGSFVNQWSQNPDFFYLWVLIDACLIMWSFEFHFLFRFPAYIKQSAVIYIWMSRLVGLYVDRNICSRSRNQKAFASCLISCYWLQLHVICICDHLSLIYSLIRSLNCSRYWLNDEFYIFLKAQAFGKVIFNIVSGPNSDPGSKHWLLTLSFILINTLTLSLMCELRLSFNRRWSTCKIFNWNGR
jgi:hypothetical protein